MSSSALLRCAALLAATALAACTGSTGTRGPAELGDFRLGHNIVIADNVQEGPFSRDLDVDQIETAMRDEVDDRLRRYDGDGLYHLGIYIGAMVLAQPGVPVLFAPRSNMVFEVFAFDNATQSRLNEEPNRIIVSEGLDNSVPILGSGLTRTPEEQLANLVENAAIQIEDWLIENPDWFDPKPGQVRVPFGEAEVEAQGEAAREAAETFGEETGLIGGEAPPG